MLNFTHNSNLPYLILSYAYMQHQILPYADSRWLEETKVFERSEKCNHIAKQMNMKKRKRNHISSDFVSLRFIRMY